METPACENYRAVYLTAEDLRIAASIIYNAYHDDPFFRDVLYRGDLHLYEQKLRAAIREELNELWQQEQTLVGLFEEDRLVGVVCVFSQQAGIGEGRFWHWRLKMMLNTGWKSTQALMSKESSILEHLPGKNCAVIQFVCVAPFEQGKGLGARLLRAVTSWCDEQPELDGVGVFVSQQSHAHLFNRHRFIPLTHLTIGNVEGDLMFYKRQPDEQ
ncbi:GNAT family N-acetyltransferase [Shewanella sp. GXUN23E]|uniref:GNAT family N-acetyltransferase n=1 Tax=Shewanella sp. GXUN23E TaxID=3422498 RepID=UPI003D7E2DAF